MSRRWVTSSGFNQAFDRQPSNKGGRVTLLPTSSARAHTAAEAKFRITYPLAPARAVRVIALDSGAEAIVRRAAAMPWHSASFFTAGTSWSREVFEGGPGEVILHDLDGASASLNELLTDIDATIMVATADTGTEAASAIGSACAIRGIMTAGLVFGRSTSSMTVSALRPYARVLVVSNDESDLEAILIAMRA